MTDKFFLATMCVGSYDFIAVGTTEKKAEDAVWKKYKNSGFPLPAKAQKHTKKYLMYEWFGVNVDELHVDGEAIIR